MMPKTDVSQLALFGGPPVFRDPLHVGRPNLGDRARLLARLEEALDRRWLTNHGPLVQQFEAALAPVVGAPEVISTSNATVALELVFRDLVAQRGPGEVVMPAVTFIATAHAALNAGLTPRFVDVAPGTCHPGPDQVSAACSSQTRAITGVHLWGMSCDVVGLDRVARREGLPLIFDAAHGLGVTADGKPHGAFGDATVFSFHATKVANAFEGGAIATSDPARARRLRLASNFGISGEDQVDAPGTNAKMSEASAAMGLTSLESLAGFIDANRVHAKAYREELQGVPGLKLISPPSEAPSNHHYVVLTIDPARFGLTRDQLLAVLQAERVLARRYFWPGCHRSAPYVTQPPWSGVGLPESDRLLERVLSLPTGPTLAPLEVAAVCGLLRFAAANSTQIQTRLAAG